MVKCTALMLWKALLGGGRGRCGRRGIRFGPANLPGWINGPGRKLANALAAFFVIDTRLRHIKALGSVPGSDDWIRGNHLFGRAHNSISIALQALAAL